MLRRLFFVIFCFGFCIANAQFKLKQMERCYNSVTQTFSDSCFIMTDASGFQRYIDISVLRTIAGGTITPTQLCNALKAISIGSVNATDYFITASATGCKRVLSSNIVTGSALCTAINQIGIQTYTRGDRLIFQKADGTCYRDSIRWDQYGGINCDDVLDCVTNDPDWCNEVKACITNTYLCDNLNLFGTQNFIPTYLIGVNSNGTCARVDGTLFGTGATCTALKQFTFNSSVDTLIGIKNGQCYRTKISSGSNFNCDSVKSCISQNWFCDSILVCLENDTDFCNIVKDCIDDFDLKDKVCEAMQSFQFTDGNNSGDTVIIVRDGQCYKSNIAFTGGSNFNCDSVKACLSQDWFCDSVQACITDLYLCEALFSFGDAELQEGFKIIVDNGATCKKSTICVTGSQCLNFQIAGGCFEADVIVSPNSNNKLVCQNDGLFVDGATPNEVCGILNTYGSGGTLTQGDQVLVRGNPCIWKTVPCWNPCGPPDFNPNNRIALSELEKRLAKSEALNIELLKRIEKLEKRK